MSCVSVAFCYFWGHVSLCFIEVNSLRQELQLLASHKSVTIVAGGGSGSGKYGVVVIVVVVGYGYVWWKGWTLSKMMFATRRGLNDACSSVAKQLETVYSSISTTRRHLSSKIDSVDCKIDECADNTSATKEEVMRSGVPNFCAVALALNDLGFTEIFNKMNFVFGRSFTKQCGWVFSYSPWFPCKALDWPFYQPITYVLGFRSIPGTKIEPAQFIFRQERIKCRQLGMLPSLKFSLNLVCEALNMEQPYSDEEIDDRRSGKYTFSRTSVFRDVLETILSITSFFRRSRKYTFQNAFFEDVLESILSRTPFLGDVLESIFSRTSVLETFSKIHFP
ncbi:hypothetical protein PHJA_001541700 [Phtheirospermum japonicum]|uniref:DUF1664 domain-containing protein n=1 Tax=Phtheirospermum japonicum TaxID=374723 RepID=A0A830CD77_9LAMI|nr:hypothetical protein PHJA_001541700 [Phtheirospermum japonicum]